MLEGKKRIRLSTCVLRLTWDVCLPSPFHSHIAVALDSLINIFLFCFATVSIKSFGACNIPLGRHLQVLKFQTYQLVDQKNKFALKFLSSRCRTLIDETCGSKFKGHSMEDVVYLHRL